MDDSLAQQPDVYFEEGDHTNLVHVSGISFQKLMAEALQGGSQDSFEAARLVLLGS